MKVITLKTLSQATEQEVFDQVAAHLLTQGEVSASSVACRYRGPRGLKCAAGCLISDDEYKPEMDEGFIGTSWRHLIEEGVVSDSHARLISDLQGCHDSLKPSLWPAYLKEIAQEYGLVYNEHLYPQNKQGEQNAD